MGVLAAQAGGVATALVMAVLGAAGSVWCVLYVRKSLRRGWIAYAGNSPSTSRTQRYRREETALGFWAGIVVYALMAAIGAGLAAVCVLLLVAR